jgi:SAM-dependent methyltransferase
MSARRAWDAERMNRSPFIPAWVRHEHEARYAFAARFVVSRAVVDCACGDGGGAATFLRAGARIVWGFDVSAKAVALARRRCSSTAGRFYVADGRRLPLPAGHADVFISLETIEHIDEDCAFLQEVQRVLAPDGVFICSTPNRAVTNPGRSVGEAPVNPYHVREYAPQEFADLLSRGFAQVELLGQNPQSPPGVHLLGTIGALRLGHLAARAHQLAKLPSLISDRPAFHDVQKITDRSCEYLVAVCRAPRRP